MSSITPSVGLVTESVFTFSFAALIISSAFSTSNFFISSCDSNCCTSISAAFNASAGRPAFLSFVIFVSLHQFAFGTMLLLLCDFLLHFCFRYTLFRSRVIIFKRSCPFYFITFLQLIHTYLLLGQMKLFRSRLE